MIFASLGTHEQPFERVLDLLASARGEEEEELVVQHGHTAARPALPNSRWLRFTGYDQLTRLVYDSDAIVSHAGVGTILTAIRLGKTPVVVPRLSEHGEHVDDHQLQIAREFGRRGLVRPCLDATDLGLAIEETRHRRPGPLSTDRGLRSAVAAATPRSCACEGTGWVVELDRIRYEPPGESGALRVAPCGCRGRRVRRRASPVHRLIAPLTRS